MAAFRTVGLRILDILRDAYGDSGEFNSFFWGDIQLIAKDSLPAIVVEETGDITTNDYTGMDATTITVVIKVIRDKRTDWDTATSHEQDNTYAQIFETINGRDPATGLYAPKSIKGIVRKNFTLGNNPSPGVPVVDQTMRTNYSIGKREDIITQEGHVTLTVRELELVPNRI